jgi:hypothetical protein
MRRWNGYEVREWEIYENGNNILPLPLTKERVQLGGERFRIF